MAGWRSARACCILAASGIGDALMATPLFEEMKRLRPSMKLIVAASNSTKQVFESNPLIDRLITYETGGLKSILSMAARLRKERIGILFAAQPSNTVAHSVIAALSGARFKLKHDYDYGDEVHRDYSIIFHALLPNDHDRHRVELNLDFLRFLGEPIPEGTSYPKYYLKPSSWVRIVELLASNSVNKGRMAAIHPGGLRPEKKWPAVRFAEVAAELINQGWEIIIVGSRHEKDDADAIKRLCRGAHNVTGMLGLDETAALLKKCRLLISNDTGIMHLATAVGTPVVAVFGPTNHKHIGPCGSESVVVATDADVKRVYKSDVLRAVAAKIPTPAKIPCEPLP